MKECWTIIMLNFLLSRFLVLLLCYHYLHCYCYCYCHHHYYCYLFSGIPRAFAMPICVRSIHWVDGYTSIPSSVGTHTHCCVSIVKWYWVPISKFPWITWTTSLWPGTKNINYILLTRSKGNKSRGSVPPVYTP